MSVFQDSRIIAFPILNLISFSCYRVDPDSALFTDLQTYKEKEGRDHILLNCSFKVSISGFSLAKF